MIDRENDENDEVIERVTARLRAVVRLDPGFDERVMRQVRAAPRAHRAPWLVRPRSLVASPLQMLALAAGIAGVAVLGARLAWRTSGDRPVSEARAARRGDPGATMVQFVLVAPAASSVSLVGDFNDWNPMATRLRPAPSNGLWMVEVPLTPGRHQYAFIVDGTRWMADPASPHAVEEDFGLPNSVITVSEPVREDPSL
jgi:hypothetical protein